MSAQGLGEFHGRHAVVTGGSGGIGAVIAAALVAKGARVSILGRNPTTLDTTAREIGSVDVISGFAADITQPRSLREGIAQASDRYGAVYYLINSAGQATSAPFHRTDEDLWRRMLEVNLTGTYHCIQAVLPGMQQRNEGRIVNIVSTAGLKGYPYVTAYAAAKHGVVGLTRALAMELAKTQITVNAVCPAYTDTAIVQDALENIVAKTGRSLADALVALLSGSPQQRLIEPDEIAATVLWLCSHQARSITGQSIALAGGEIM